MYLEIFLYSYALDMLFYELAFPFFSCVVAREEAPFALFFSIPPTMPLHISVQTDPINVTD